MSLEERLYFIGNHFPLWMFFGLLCSAPVPLVLPRGTLELVFTIGFLLGTIPTSLAIWFQIKRSRKRVAAALGS